MKWKFLEKTVAAISMLLGLNELPIDGEKNALDLSAEQRQKVVDALGEKLAQEAIDGIDKEIKNLASNNLNLKAIEDELAALVAESGLTAEELKTLENKNADDGSPDSVAALKAIVAKSKEKDAMIAKLISEPVGDLPMHVINGLSNKNNNNMTHSATHLFASGKKYDAFDGGRSWNARLRDGGMQATDFNKTGVIPTLQADMDHFVEENNGILESLFNDFRSLPTQWGLRTGVLDRVSEGNIIAGEIVQGRAPGWSPKNIFGISSEKGQVYRKKIDITFDGHKLQEIENTWIRGYNKEGSQPWKMSFIGFLLVELMKQQILDDRIAQINGIYVESIGGDDNPGAAVNSQNGLRYLWYHYRDVEKKYRAFDIGAPTESNIVDYINTMIEMIPEVERSAQGLEIQLSTKWYKAYLKRAGELRPQLVNNAGDQSKSLYQSDSPLDYPNFIFQPLVDQTKTDFIGITYSKNVQVLEYLSSEKTKYTVTHEKRNTHIFADYRLGIRFIMVGTKLKEGDPKAFEVQKVWSNNMPVFGSEVFAPAFDNGSGILKITYPSIAIDGAWKTNIESIEGATKGSVIRIKGNKDLLAAKQLVSNSELLLTANFDLSTGGTITLFAQQDGKFKEIERTDVPAVATTTDIDFSTAVIDVKGGTVFRYTGVTTTITNILNGVESKTIKVYGKTGVTVTVADVAGKINVGSTAVLAIDADFIQLTYVNGIWVETDRLID
jgi:hypothetical protein